MNKWTNLILLVLASLAATAPRNTLRQGLLKLFTKWRNGDTSSLPFALPSPRNINIEPQSRYYKDYTLTLNDAVLEGLETLTVEALSVSETESGLTASLVINVPRLTLTAGPYRLKATKWYKKWNNCHGSLFQSVIYNFRVTASMSFEADGSNTELQSLNLDYSFYTTTSYLEDANIFVKENFDSRLQEYLTDRKYSIIDEARTLIMNKVNSVLRGYSPEQLKTIIREI